jgi:hypothetical protein
VRWVGIDIQPNLFLGEDIFHRFSFTSLERCRGVAAPCGPQCWMRVTFVPLRITLPHPKYSRYRYAPLQRYVVGSFPWPFPRKHRSPEDAPPEAATWRFSCPQHVAVSQESAVVFRRPTCLRTRYSVLRTPERPLLQHHRWERSGRWNISGGRARG